MAKLTPHLDVNIKLDHVHIHCNTKDQIQNRGMLKGIRFDFILRHTSCLKSVKYDEKI